MIANQTVFRVSLEQNTSEEKGVCVIRGKRCFRPCGEMAHHSRLLRQMVSTGSVTCSREADSLLMLQEEA